MPDPGKAISIMLGGPGEMPGGGEEQQDPYEEAFHAMSESLLSAIKSNDVDAFATALKDAIELCVEQRESEAAEGGNSHPKEPEY